MRYAVIADIHANLEALAAVQAYLQPLGPDKIVCCGDLVGYHADPNECVRRVRDAGMLTIRGNHDMAACGQKDPRVMWDLAEKAICWTRRELTEENTAFLATRPATLVVDGRFLVFHGALHPQQNPEDLHLDDAEDIRLSLEALRRHPSGVALAFYGHTHVPAVQRLKAGRFESLPAEDMTLDRDAFYLVNPGSVGLSRDEDRRASLALYDPETARIEFRRIAYDGMECQRKTVAAGLVRDPAALRLFHRAVRKLNRILVRA
jgi:predicted phosphodiesterase